MQDAILVAVGHALKQLLHVALDVGGREAQPRIGQAGEVVIAEFHHHVDGPLPVVVFARCKEIALLCLMLAQSTTGQLPPTTRTARWQQGRPGGC